jgi:hypothetical protein
MEEFTSLYLPAAGSAAKECAECHMPRYVARLTQGHVLSLIHPKRLVPDHSFPLWTEAFTAGAVEVSRFAARKDTPSELTIEVTLLNVGAGHRVPTGKFGHREVRIRVEVRDNEDHVVGLGGESLSAKTTRALLPGQPNDFSLFIRLYEDSDPRRIVLLVERVNEDRSFRHTLAEGEIPVPDFPSD